MTKPETSSEIHDNYIKINQAKINRCKLKVHTSDLQAWNSVNSVNIIRYTDASFNSLTQGGSQGSLIIFFSDGNKKGAKLYGTNKKLGMRLVIQPPNVFL